MIRRGFTLMEILVSILLLSVALLPVISLLMYALRDAQQIRRWYSMLPQAEAAAAWCALQRHTGSQAVDLPAAGFDSSYGFRIEQDAQTTVSVAGNTIGILVRYRVRCYDSPADRDRAFAGGGTGEVGLRGSFLVERYIKELP